jgi:hypothetical protein
MRRISLVLGVALIMATMLVLTVGSALAKNTKPKPDYISEVYALQYFASPGVSKFFGEVTDPEGDEDPGLTGQLNTTIFYNYPAGRPGRGVETTITGGTWTLTGPDVALQGTVSGGTAKWDTLADPDGVPIDNGALVYGGEAAVEAYFINVSGTVDGVSVSGGTGELKGTLDHNPLEAAPDEPPILRTSPDDDPLEPGDDAPLEPDGAWELTF